MDVTAALPRGRAARNLLRGGLIVAGCALVAHCSDQGPPRQEYAPPEEGQVATVTLTATYASAAHAHICDHATHNQWKYIGEVQDHLAESLVKNMKVPTSSIDTLVPAGEPVSIFLSNTIPGDKMTKYCGLGVRFTPQRDKRYEITWFWQGTQVGCRVGVFEVMPGSKGLRYGPVQSSPVNDASICPS